LAKITGFSQSTISRAFNDRYGTNPETKEKIMRAAREIGYRSSASPARPPTREWKILVPDLLENFYTGLGAFIAQEALPLQLYPTLTGSFHQPRQEMEILSELNPQQIEALIVAPLSAASHSLLAQLQTRGLAVLALDGAANDYFDTVEFDFSSSLRCLVRHLLELGHETFGYLGHAPAQNYPRPAYACYQAELKKHHRDLAANHVNFCPDHEDPGFFALEAWQQAGRPPTAVFCQTDAIALSLLHRARQRGWKIPEDLSIIGQYDLAAAQAAGLTTLRIDQPKAGRLICGMVQDRCRFPRRATRHAQVRAELILRQSHGRAPGK
jgi:DNA-binding LacI/PurR family transcriptional regulator